MQRTSGRLVVLIVGSALAVGGWGAVLPYLYGDISTARGLGGLAAAGTFTAFALGSLVAAPIAGRLADTRPPTLVSAGASLAMAAGTVALALSDTVYGIWTAAAATGAAFAVGQPAVQVLLLEWSPADRRRDIFAWKFIANNVGIAGGGLAGGFLVTLDRPDGVRPAYAIAVLAAVAGAGLVASVGRRGRVACPEPVVSGSLVTVLRTPAMQTLLGVTFLLMLACYAQLDAGLPAYALSALHVKPSLLGTAVAINCVLVSVLTAPVVRATRHRDSATLLATCATVWIGCWLLLGLPMVISVGTTAMMIGGFGGFAVGETMLSPVLSPLAARLAPTGSAGRALGVVTGAQTAAQAIGPALSGALFALHLPAGFIVLQIACCLASIALATRLGRLLRTLPAPEPVAVA